MGRLFQRQAHTVGNIGICCSQFLDDFQPVSTKMAKIQSMSLNPAKISGTCGRLMCCLRYEEEAYENLVKTVPKNGAFVETPAGYGNVTQVNLLRRTVKVRLDGEGEDVYKTYSADEIAAIPGGRPKPGEPLPHLLKARPAPEEPAAEAQDEPEERPEQYMEAEEAAQPAPAAEEPRRVSVQREGSHPRSRHGDRPKREGSSQKREGSAPRQDGGKPRRSEGQRQGGKARGAAQQPRQQREQQQPREQAARPPRRASPRGPVRLDRSGPSCYNISHNIPKGGIRLGPNRGSNTAAIRLHRHQRHFRGDGDRPYLSE